MTTGEFNGVELGGRNWLHQLVMFFSKDLFSLYSQGTLGDSLQLQVPALQVKGFEFISLNGGLLFVPNGSMPQLGIFKHQN